MAIGKTKVAVKSRSARKSANREKLIVDHLPLVKHVLSRMAGHLPAHVDREDLLEAGMLGLIDAADRFDPSRKVQFHTYALTRIRGAMVDYLRSEDWLPRSARSELTRISQVRAVIEQETGRPASLSEIGQRIGLRERKLARLTRASEACNFCSLSDIPAGMMNEEGELSGAHHQGLEAHPERRAILEEDKERLTAAIQELSQTERLVISLYYFEQMPLRAIAGTLHVTDSRVCQIHRMALNRLQRAMKEPSFELVTASA